METAAGLPYQEAQVRMTLVGLLAARGDLAGALAAADRAEPLLRGADAARLTANRACALARAGRLDEALAAIPRLRSGEDPAALAGLLTNLGLARALRGDLGPAESALTEAVEVAERAGLRHQAAMARGNLAFVASRKGDVPLALRLYEVAEADLTGERLAQVRLDRAETLITAGLPGEARPLLEQTLADAARRGYACDAADGLLLLAHAELADGDPERAAATAERARAAFAAQERPGWTLAAEALLLRARWAGGDRSPVFLRTATATAERLARGGWAEAAAEAWIIAARLSLELGRPVRALPAEVERARRRGPAALRAAAWHATALDRWARGDRRGTVAAVWAGLRVVAEHAEIMSVLDLRSHAAGLGDELAGFALRLARSARETLLAEERRRAVARRPVAVRPPRDPSRAAALAELRAASAAHAAATADGALAPADLAASAERLARLERAVQTATRARAAAARVPPWDPADVPLALMRLPDALGDRALLELVRIGDDLHAVTVAGGRCRRLRLGPYRAVERDVHLVRFALRSLVMADGLDEAAWAGLTQAARRVQAAVLEPPADALGDRELVIAPTGALHGLPWRALPLLAARPFTVVPSAAAWLRAHEASRPRAGRVVLVSGPRLEHAAGEVLALAELHPDATVLTGSAARVDDVRRALDGAAMTHLAAHGYVRRGNALLSHLELADGPLMGYDLQDLERPPATIVLSGCDTGRSEAGDAVTGLAGVLLGAGTATVIASVAPVGDRAARDAMIDFHVRLARGVPPAAALAAVPRTPGITGFQCFGAG
ncbi:CHAT domain-containing protein [Actinomadura rubrobrunea]|uniref:CHAT domain-containing protein n=1 Tax=Actinomadura rubrobrunea TaxID=115335 RepID=A0A9W6Q1F6_9ACTN|nr:CHAT domain-containing protein [Actinomadura rubrobrunea]